MTQPTRRPSRPHQPLRFALATMIGLVLAAEAVFAAPVIATTVTPAVDPAPAAARRQAPGRAPGLAAETAAAPSVRSDPSTDSGAEPGVDEGGGLIPTVQYEDAIDHADDVIAFEAGGRVDVPFTPRSDDRWTVGGRSPRALPAGRTSGRAMAKAGQGSRWTVEAGSEPPPAAKASAATGAPIDAPSNGPAAIGALSTSASVAGEAPAIEAPAAASGLRREVFGFLPYWEVSDSTTTLNYDLLSTIAYFSVGSDKLGNLLKKNSDGTTTTGWGGWTSSKMTSVITAAHKKNTRVVLTISMFAWTTSQVTSQGALLGSSAARLNLARQAAAAVRDRGADGINLDFEPIASGYANEFTALVRTVRQELDAIAPGYQLTFDTTGYIGNYPLEDATAAGAADAIFIMGYDYRTASSLSAGSIDPLSGPAYDLTDTVIAYRNRVPASKLILGVPYYGRAWSTVSSSVNAKTQSGTQHGTSSSVNYTTAVDYAAKYGRKWDSREQSPWIAYQRENCTTTYGCVTSWRQIYYDDVTSLKARYDMINSYGLRGAGMWALGYDGTRPELYGALADKFLNDTTPPVAGVSVLGATQRDEGFAVRWTATDDFSSIASYDVQVSTDGGPWTAWLTGTTATTEVWFGANGHEYAFRVRAKDAKGNLSSWNVSPTTAGPGLAIDGFATVGVDSLSGRASPTTSATKVTTFDTGEVVAITDGPVSAGGYTWYEVTGPLTEWGTINTTHSGLWSAAGSGSAVYLAGRRAPNSTAVSAGISGLSFGSVGSSSVGSTSAAAGTRALSPNGDGSGDTLPLNWTNATTLGSLTLKILRADGTVAGTKSLTTHLGAGARSYAFDGKIGSTPLADGVYVLQLVGVDGSKTYSAPSATTVSAAQLAAYGVTIDTVAPVVTGGTATTLFSPNADGRLDTMPVSISATGATGWRLTVAPLVNSVAGSAIRSTTGSGTLSTAWDGRTDGGSVAPDGIYRVTLAATDPAGNAAGRSWDVTLDTRSPVVSTAAAPEAFSPNADKVGDTTKMSWTSDEAAAGTVSILKGTTTVKAWAFTSRATWSTTWDGKDKAGKLVADGRYTFQVDGRDAAGNRRVEKRTITVDRTVGSFGASPTSFYPQDGDALSPTTSISFKTIRSSTVTLWIYDATGALVRSVWTGRSLAAGTLRWTWNGKSNSGAYVAPGIYTARLTVAGSLGTTLLSKTIRADAFAISTTGSLVAGTTLTVNVTTVEPLKAAPKIAFRQSGLTAVTKTATSLGSGKYRATFTIAAAPGSATITVTGTDSGGRTNRSSLVVAVS